MERERTGKGCYSAPSCGMCWTKSLERIVGRYLSTPCHRAQGMSLFGTGVYLSSKLKHTTHECHDQPSSYCLARHHGYLNLCMPFALQKRTAKSLLCPAITKHVPESLISHACVQLSDFETSRRYSPVVFPEHVYGLHSHPPEASAHSKGTGHVKVRLACVLSM